MASGAIALAGAVAPSIIELITALVHRSAPAAEQALGPKTGPAKFGRVYGDVIDGLTAAAKAGQIGKDLPSDQTIQIIIQAVVTSLQLSGLLTTPADGPSSSATSSGQTISLKPGQTLSIQAVAA